MEAEKLKQEVERVHGKAMMVGFGTNGVSGGCFYAVRIEFEVLADVPFLRVYVGKRKPMVAYVRAELVNYVRGHKEA
jgi:hypothetical protein